MDIVSSVRCCGTVAGLFPLLASAHPGHPGHELIADPGTALACLLALVAATAAVLWHEWRGATASGCESGLPGTSSS